MQYSVSCLQFFAKHLWEELFDYNTQYNHFSFLENCTEDLCYTTCLQDIKVDTLQV